jgi:hypothetical protein
MKYIVHQMLENNKRVNKAKWHHKILKMAITSSERLYSIHRLLECVPNCMLHVNQSWCTPWHD